MRGKYISVWGDVSIATDCDVEMISDEDGKNERPAAHNIINAEVTGLGEEPTEVLVAIPEKEEVWQDFYDADNEIEYEDGKPLEI